MSQPPARWPVMVLALAMQASAIGFGIYCFTFFVVPWAETFDVPRSRLMLGYTLHSAFGVGYSLIGGILIDRYPPRRLVIAACGIFCLALLAIARAPSEWVVVGVYAAFVPIGLILCGPLMAQTLVAQTYTESQGRALGISSLGTSLGGFVLPLLVTPLLATYGWREVWEWIGVGIAMTVLPLAFFVLRTHEAGGGHAHGTEDGRSTRELMRDPAVYLLAFSMVIPSAMLMAVLHNVGPLAEDLELDEARAGQLVAGTSVLMAAGKYLIGELSDRVSHLRLYLALVILVALGLVIAALATSFVALAGGLFLLGTTAGGALPLISAAGVRRFGAGNLGRVLGVVFAVAALSGATPLFASWVRDATGSYRPGFLALAPLLVVAAWLFRRFDQGAMR